MKKISAVILTLAMILCLGAAVPPESTGSPSGELIGEVPVNAIALTDGDEDVYNVTVKWDDLNFTYTFTSLGTWNTTDHKYDGDASGTWEEEARTITITNNSTGDGTAGYSGGIIATASVEIDSGAGIECEITGSSEYWEENTTTMHINGGEADNTGEFTLTMTGNPPLSYFISEEWDPLSGEPATKVFGVFTITLVSRNL